MSEEVEVMRAIGAAKKEQKSVLAAANVKLLEQLNIPAYEQSKNVYRVDSTAGAVIYYPGSDKWQHRGRTYSGPVEQFRIWLKKNHML